MTNLRSITFYHLLFSFVLIFPIGTSAAYQSNLPAAISWINDHQNDDGSWGGSVSERFILTAEVVRALDSAGRREVAYYKGINWLENHALDNFDYVSRKMFARDSYSDKFETFLSKLDMAQDNLLSSRNGWGISTEYLQSPLDTAIILIGLENVCTSRCNSIVDYKAALNYLKSVQINGSGWSVSLSSVTDEFTTAWVIRALNVWKNQDPTVSNFISSALNYLSSSVNSSSPTHIQALVAQTAIESGFSDIAKGWLNNLVSVQKDNGSVDNDIYSTALVINAFSNADQVDADELKSIVSVPDAALRSAINIALGRNRLDALNKRDLAQLTILSAANLGIYDLTGLEWAVNLKELDVSNNHISATSPIDGLSITVLTLDGNPVDDIDNDGISNSTEIAYGLNPDSPDSDGDGLTDLQEVCFDNDCTSYIPFPGGNDTDGLRSDTDQDGMADGDEVAVSRSPILNELLIIDIVTEY